MIETLLALTAAHLVSDFVLQTNAMVAHAAGHHWIAPGFRVEQYGVTPSIMEPDALADLGWFDLYALLSTLTEATKQAVAAMLRSPDDQQGRFVALPNPHSHASKPEDLTHLAPTTLDTLQPLADRTHSPVDEQPRARR